MTTHSRARTALLALATLALALVVWGAYTLDLLDLLKRLHGVR